MREAACPVFSHGDYRANPAPDVSSLKRVALLLAGGDGRRLQEFTRAIAGSPIPKQYCRLLDGSSLLEFTLRRAQLFSARERISVIVNVDHLNFAREQLRDVPESNVFVQPRNRDTGPGMIFSLINLERIYKDAIVAVFPTDHYIGNDWAFIAQVQHAAHAIRRMPEKIAILGIVPDRPETGYGYILPSGRLGAFERSYDVKAFTEKPSADKARGIISSGGLWNSFVMVFRLSRMMKLLQVTVPHEFARLSALREAPEQTAAVYQDLDPWNLSTRFLSRIPRHLIVTRVANVHWSDWGTRESIERTYRKLNLLPLSNRCSLETDLRCGRRPVKGE